MSITLLIAALQGAVLAALLWRARANRDANRALAALILVMVALLVPYIIGYAGFYDAFPWLSFAPFSYTLALGPLLYRYTARLTGAPMLRFWPHLLPAAVQFLADALIFPLPLATKNWWDSQVAAPWLSPLFEWGCFASLLLYGVAAWRQYRSYRDWLAENRTDGVDFDPRWIAHMLMALALILAVWVGFAAANLLNPARNYFDQFWLYVAFSLLVLYLGIEGWRHAALVYPLAGTGELATAERAPRDWVAQGEAWLAQIEAEQYWRDPDLTLASLARHLGTNSSYVSRGFNAGLGGNFNTIINRRRVAAVQHALAQPDETRSLLTIAFEAGFASKASFNRAFGELVGMSPSAWRLKSQK